MLKSKGKNYRASAAAYMLFLSVLLPQYSRRYKHNYIIIIKYYTMGGVPATTDWDHACWFTLELVLRLEFRVIAVNRGHALVDGCEGQGHHCQPRPYSLPAFCARSISNIRDIRMSVHNEVPIPRLHREGVAMRGPEQDVTVTYSHSINRSRIRPDVW